ncbi:PA2169 family four-helix-bundle protein [Acidicapsa dinghuensis]|uniref:PA2169 family four-helix-bundle protein n=1 Tax=Acidicapsa dinghuensis TaxID=2218256 RepID=A0ABW1E9P1_9BACT|nr:PA2169 family four-helix-bundle protein [Acidicapsa dinghuensis]
MSHPSTTLQNQEYALQNIIKALIDGQQGFQSIGESMQDEALKTFFLAESLEQARFRGELEADLHIEGVRDIETHGTANGTLLRIWGELKNKLGGGDKALLTTAEEATRDTLQTYNEALGYELPLPVRQILVNQGTHLEAVHDQIEAALLARG